MNMYIPNADKWIKYYKDVVDGKTDNFNTSRNIKQRGGSISGNSNEFMIPIDNSMKNNENNTKRFDVNLVSPVQQTIEQAKSEIKRKRPSSTHHSSKKTSTCKGSDRKFY